MERERQQARQKIEAAGGEEGWDGQEADYGLDDLLALTEEDARDCAAQGRTMPDPDHEDSPWSEFARNAGLSQLASDALQPLYVAAFRAAQPQGEET